MLVKFRKEALGAALLAVYGVWQAEGKVRHLIASKLVDRTELLGALPTGPIRMKGTSPSRGCGGSRESAS